MSLKIPYYIQHSEFTCGPACVLMIFKFFSPQLKLSRTLEFEVWRQCNMIGVRCADPFGICVPLLDAGYEVHLVTQHRRMIDLDLWGCRLLEQGFTPADVNLAVFGVGENKKRALSRGLAFECGRLTVERMAMSFREEFIPIALVHMGVIHQLNFPHWVVVTDAGDDHVDFNDPYPPKGGKGIRVRKEEFQRMFDDVGTRIGLSPSAIFIRN